MTDDHDDHDDQPTIERHCDVAVIGGSAAGLAAALQLVRQRRSVIVVDDATPRNAPAEHMHGYLGREGTPPSELLAIGRDEVRSYGGEVLLGRAVGVHPVDEGGFRVDMGGGHRLVARRVVAATGIADELPDIEGVAEQWGRGVIHCPFCHGYEVRDQRLVQIVTHSMGLHPTTLMRHLTSGLTVVLHAVEGIDETALQVLGEAGVTIEHTDVRRLVTAVDGVLSGVELVDGRTLAADAVMVGPRFRARAEALAPAGVHATPHPTGLGEVIEVDQTGQSAVPGLYCAGNLTDPSMQVLQAAAHGSRVGAMVGFALADDDLADAARTSGGQSDWEHRYGSPDRIWSGNPNGSLVAEVAPLAPGRAIDVGAGEGADALWLAERGWDTTACDISENALARVRDEAERRGLEVRLLHADASVLGAFGDRTYDLVCAQYASLPRTPDGRGTANLLDAVAPGGTLLLVTHDVPDAPHHHDATGAGRMFDVEAYVGVEDIAAMLDADPAWDIEVHETRPRPPGAVSTHHVDDIVLRAVKRHH